VRKYILDANIIFQFFSGSPNVKKYLLNNDEKFINAVNLSEFAYHYARKFGFKASGVKLNYLLTFINLVEIDKTLAEIASKIRLKYNLSLGDSFLVATAEMIGGTVVTSDHEFAERTAKDYDVEFIPIE
jgi:predicted nucleic acid-binding protein